jgi:hypothetical protein
LAISLIALLNPLEDVVRSSALERVMHVIFFGAVHGEFRIALQSQIDALGRGPLH